MVKIKTKRNLAQNDNKLFLISLSIMLSVAILSFFTWQRLQISKLNRKLERADKIIQQINHYNQELKLEKTSLMAASRIKVYAISKLNMRDPNPEQVILLR